MSDQSKKEMSGRPPNNVRIVKEYDFFDDDSIDPVNRYLLPKLKNPLEEINLSQNLRGDRKKKRVADGDSSGVEDQRKKARIGESNQVQDRAPRESTPPVNVTTAQSSSNVMAAEEFTPTVAESEEDARS